MRRRFAAVLFQVPQRDRHNIDPRALSFWDEALEEMLGQIIWIKILSVNSASLRADEIKIRV